MGHDNGGEAEEKAESGERVGGCEHLITYDSVVVNQRVDRRTAVLKFDLL